MAIGTAAAIGIGTAAAGALGGAISGSKKTPGTVMQNAYGAVGDQERKMQQQAMQQYLRSIGLMNEQDQAISELSPLRQQSLQGIQGLLSGQAMQATPEELQQIEQLRQAQIQLGTQDINRLLGEATGQTAASAGVRGLRGQALAELQGRNVQAAGQQIGNVVNQAGVMAAQQVMDNPYRRIAAQSPFLQQGLTYQDQLRQNAAQNRTLASNPGLLQYFQQGRQQVGTTPSSGGGLGGAIGGFLSGGAAGAGLGSQLGGLTGGFGGRVGGGAGALTGSQQAAASTPFSYRGSSGLI